jgi:hypothetical protein
MVGISRMEKPPRCLLAADRFYKQHFRTERRITDILSFEDGICKRGGGWQGRGTALHFREAAAKFPLYVHTALC